MDYYKPVVDRSKLVNATNNPLSQALFIEHQYNPILSVYSWGDEDKEHNGILYPSLKKLYIGMEDPTEYQFATTHLLNWQHWVKLNGNEYLAVHFRQWREELELKLRSQAVRAIMDQSASESGGFQAAKWLADRGWDKKGVGRPSKEEKEFEMKIKERVGEDYSNDISRMEDFRKKGK